MVFKVFLHFENFDWWQYLQWANAIINGGSDIRENISFIGCCYKYQKIKTGFGK